MTPSDMERIGVRFATIFAEKVDWIRFTHETPGEETSVMISFSADEGEEFPDIMPEDFGRVEEEA